MIYSRGVSVSTATARHWPYIVDSLRCALAEESTIPQQREHARMFSSQLRGGLGRVVVATPYGHPDDFLGWAAESCGSLVFAYVPFRLRRLGIAREMTGRLFDGGPVPLVYWTATAERIREHGFPLVHDWREFARLQRLASRRAGRSQFSERAA